MSSDESSNCGPVYLLAGIVALCVIYATVVVILDVSGYNNLVSGFTGVFLPIIMSLLALKIEIIRRQTIKQTDKVESKIGARIEDSGVRILTKSELTDRNVAELEERLKSVERKLS